MESRSRHTTIDNNYRISTVGWSKFTKLTIFVVPIEDGRAILHFSLFSVCPADARSLERESKGSSLFKYGLSDQNRVEIDQVFILYRVVGGAGRRLQVGTIQHSFLDS